MLSLNVINLFFVLNIISQLTVFISGKTCDSEQIVTKYGIKLNLWTNVNYSIQNKATLIYLFGSGFWSTHKFDIWNRDLFYRFEPTETFGVYYINSNKSSSISFNETSDEQYYEIYCKYKSFSFVKTIFLIRYIFVNMKTKCFVRK